MKKLFSTTLLAILPMIMFCQETKNDVISTTDLRTIQALVVEIDLQTVKYKLASNPDGAIHTIRKADIMTITYKNGDVEVYNTIERLQLRDELLKAQKLRANGYVWMYVGAGIIPLGYLVDYLVYGQYSTYSAYQGGREGLEFIGVAMIVTGGCMVIGGGIVALSGISRRDKANQALQTFNLYQTSNTKLNLNLNPNSFGLALRF